MNVEKMHAIGQAILAEPRRFNMELWGATVEDGIDEANHAKTAKPPCGTVCCFAGEWALLHTNTPPEKLWGPYFHKGEFSNNWRPGYEHIADMAMADLDLPNDRLFHTIVWPKDLLHPASMKPGTKRYAEHFVNVVLESYIRTNGWTETDPTDPIELLLGGA